MNIQICQSCRVTPAESEAEGLGVSFCVCAECGCTQCDLCIERCDVCKSRVCDKCAGKDQDGYAVCKGCKDDLRTIGGRI